MIVLGGGDAGPALMRVMQQVLPTLMIARVTAGEDHVVSIFIIIMIGDVAVCASLDCVGASLVVFRHMGLHDCLMVLRIVELLVF